MNREEINKELELINKKKTEAVKSQNYEMAAKIRFEELELLKQLEELEKKDNKKNDF